MKRIMKGRWMLVLLALTMTVLFIRCDDDKVVPQAIFVVNQNGYSQFNLNALQTQINGMALENLSDDEKAGLLFMREEEKLAYDVYTKLYEQWNDQVLYNIAQSELTHTEAVLLLLEKYQLTDPVGDKGMGEFENTTLQELYDNLMTLGNQSEIEALKVGAAIEEIDILDLEDQLTNIVDNGDITLVYTNLQLGPRNHLRAFVRNLDVRGVTYVPQYLSQEDYNDIIESDMENGRN